jgi:lysophospholipase L1-like esterase
MFAQRPPEKILELNRWLKDYCGNSSNGCSYLDYFTAMVDEQGHLRKDLSNDGLHPNEAGTAIMSSLAEASIEKAIAGRLSP